MQMIYTYWKWMYRSFSFYFQMSGSVPISNGGNAYHDIRLFILPRHDIAIFIYKFVRHLRRR